MKRSISFIGHLAAPVGLVALILAIGAGSRAAAYSAGSAGALILAQLTEHNLGPEDLPPTSMPTGPTGSAVASPASAAPAASGPTPGLAPSPAAVSTAQPEVGEAPPPGDSDSDALMTPAAAVATPAPPPLDYANLPPSMPVSDSSLDPIIQKTTDPARVASLRITEEARRQLAAGHPDEAIRMLGRAISVDASNPYAYFFLGRAYFVRKDYGQALTFLARAEIGIGSDPAWLGETLSFEGACYEELGRDREAADAYQHATRVAPDNLMARVGYGRLAPELPPPTPVPESSSDIGALDEPPPVESTPEPVPGPPAAAPSPADSTDD